MFSFYAWSFMVALNPFKVLHLFRSNINFHLQTKQYFYNFRSVNTHSVRQGITISTKSIQMNREFDIVVFGATGYTGQFVVEEVARTLQNDNTKFTWAIAGRNKDKLNEVLKTASKQVNQELDGIGLIEADVSNEESLLAMCKRTRLIMNCVGPYRLYGEPVIKACIEAGTHHVDVSGEPSYLETVQLLHSKEAENKEIYIIGSCGWDSIPCDLGVQFLKSNFKGEINSVESYMKVITGPNGQHINVGTWHSAIGGVANLNKLKEIRRRLYNEVLNAKFLPKYKLKRRVIPFWNEKVNGWCVPFPGSDRSVVQRTQKYQYIHYNERPAQCEAYFIIPSFLYLLATIFIAGIFGLFASFNFGRTLLKRYPKFFSFGVIVPEGPKKEDLKHNRFVLTLVGKGWGEKLSDPLSEPVGEPDKLIVAKVEGPDCGYIATSSFLVQSGLTILKESDKMPGKGGVLTPGSAFINTSIIDRLKQRNITYKIVENS